MDAATITKLADTVTKLTETVDRISRTPASRASGDLDWARGGTGSPPTVMKGKFGDVSRPFSITRFLLNGLRDLNPERAKPEMDTMTRFKKGLERVGHARGCEHMTYGSSHFYLPVFDFKMLGDDAQGDEDIRYVKSVFAASQDYDPDEADWLVRRYPQYRKAQSAFQEAFGGTIVQPPLQGAAIPIVRPKAAFLAAGAQTVTLPPQGRLVRPRLIQPTVAQALGEGNVTPDSTVTTDQMTLMAKKIGASTTITEEANTFTSGTLDTLVRADLDRTLGLQIDAYGFYGTGGNLIPAGVMSPMYNTVAAGGTVPNANAAAAVLNIDSTFPTGKGVGTNGNTLLPQYADLFSALIGERSFDVEASTGAFVMRPGALAAARSYRATVLANGDQQGVFVDVLRKFSEVGGEVWSGKKVVQTTNINGLRTKGTGTGLSDVFYGIWEHAILASYGAIQFTMGTVNTDFTQGQYRIRGVLYGDIGFEYPAAFLTFLNVLGVQGQI